MKQITMIMNENDGGGVGGIVVVDGGVDNNDRVRV